MTKVVHVAVAMIRKPTGEYLLASRPNGKGWAGWWEFPGGKIEANETPIHALSRELKEELGIVPTKTQSWIKRRFDYPATHDAEAKTVCLHFFFVTEWQGEPTPLEGQALAWQNPRQLTVEPILPANAPIMHAISLPDIYAITNLAEMGEAAFFTALQRQLQQGVRLIQVREKQLDRNALAKFAGKVQAMAYEVGAKVLLNENIALAKELGLDGMHLPSQALMALERKPEGMIVAASCHNPIELDQAQSLGLDLVTLSPVNATKSHPNAAPLGWEQFASLLETATIPVYALGGMQINDLPHALSAGARGVAMQRAVWETTDS